MPTSSSSGPKKIFCRTSDVFSTTKLEIRQGTWHPNVGSQILLLTSDDVLRCFDVTQPREVLWTCTTCDFGGHISALQPSSPNRGGLFGDASQSLSTAFAFDPCFSHPSDPSVGESTTIYAIQQNGDLFVAYPSLSTGKRRFKACGPCLMIPSLETSSTMEVSSMICLEVEPSLPLLIIADTFNGLVHHCLVLPQQKTTDEIKIPDVFVVESVLIEQSTAADTDTGGRQPLSLLKDEIIGNRYFVNYVRGIYMVAIPWMDQFSTCLDNPGNAIDALKINEILTENPALLHHVVCTDPISSVSTASTGASSVSSLDTSAQTKIAGFDIHVEHMDKSHAYFLLENSNLGIVELKSQNSIRKSELLCNGLTSRSSSSHQSTTALPSSSSSTPITTHQQSDDLLGHIHEILSKSNNNPIFTSKSRLGENSSPDTQLNSGEMFKFLSRSISIFRTENVASLETARSELLKRTELLSLVRKEQLDEVPSLLESQRQLTKTAGELPAKYQLVFTRQQALNERVERVRRRLQRQVTCLSSADDDLMANLKRMEARYEKLTEEFEKLRIRCCQGYSPAEEPSGEKETDRKYKLSSSLEMSNTQSQQIKQLLADEGEQIEELIGKLEDRLK